MTQKRGLGRGLGALIPGADAAPAADQELRTRRQAPSQSSERGGSNRPVDMFFSGERSADEDDQPQRERNGSTDIAGEMARAAAERRTKTGGNGARTGTSSSSATKRRSSAGSGKSSSSDGSSGTATKRRSTAKRSASSTSSRSRSGSGASKAAKESVEPATGDARGSETPVSTGNQAQDSPVVDIEQAASTPARSDDNTAAAPTEPADGAVGAGTAPDADTAPEQKSTAPESGTPAEPGAASSVEAAPAAEESSAREAGLMAVPGAEFAEIPTHEVRENPRNPRSVFDEDELDELAFSLRQVGVLQPVVVRPIPVTEDGESFELVMGERRWRAARRAGLSSIPAIIRETSDDDLLRDALLENLHRTQLNPLEEAAAYQQLLEDFGCTQDELGDRIGRSRPQITNTLRLLRLPPLVQRRLASGALSAGHARALLALDEPSLMEELAQRIVAEGLSVRAVERLVTAGGQPATARPARRSTYDPHVVDLTSRLSNRLETQVRIDVGKRKGRITLEFTNLEDLERLIENIGVEVPSEHAEQRSSDD